MKSDQILKIYKAVTLKVKKYKYPPRRKHYNIHTYG